ncbi:PH domain-containing protein [Oerskovia flava]|uniref:PH domain-containing protein n=1 Tax=Oerskovia flava TaxID=2986422 RepID=UPI00223FBBF8|nr:PH domain-containing protein [Oerskovia sp. JB1-3-2]
MGQIHKNLAEGETVVMTLRTHVKALFAPFLVLLLLVAAVVALVVLAPPDPIVLWIVVGVAGLAAIIWIVVPHLRWMTTTYVVTNKRIAMRSGIITRVGRDIPLYRINDVNSERDLIDRMLGCGTLVISDATEKAGMTLYDVPRVEEVRTRLHNLLFSADDGSDDGEWPPNEPPRGPQAPRGGRIPRRPA